MGTVQNNWSIGSAQKTRFLMHSTTHTKTNIKNLRTPCLRCFWSVWFVSLPLALFYFAIDKVHVVGWRLRQGKSGLHGLHSRRWVKFSTGLMSCSARFRLGRFTVYCVAHRSALASPNIPPIASTSDATVLFTFEHVLGNFQKHPTESSICSTFCGVNDQRIPPRTPNSSRRKVPGVVCL